MDRDQIIVVQETEYTGAGKHPMAQLSFARQSGIDIRFGNPDGDKPGENIILPEDPGQIRARPYDLDACRRSYVKNCVNNYHMTAASEEDIQFIMDETREDRSFVTEELRKHGVAG